MATLPPPKQHLSANVMRISSDLVVKYGTRVQMGEARSMMFAAAIPALHVPYVHDAWVVEQDVEYDPDYDITKCTYILMDWIHGDCLGEIWQSLDETRRGLFVHQVHDTIKALHRETLDTPGPVGGGRSNGFWFTGEGAGPFASQHEMELWFDSRLKVCQEYRTAPLDQFSFVDYLRPLVMCHLDVHTHNIIIDDQGRLWLLDWELAGAYPHYFEELFMSNDQDNPDFTAALKDLLKSPGSEDKIARIESIGFAVTTGRRLQPGQNCDANS
ncbi:hypothetical protein GQ44DRAFT_633693 [Phaeosphaeriaceae sp. PMI808]|nr:hypothetical protein GQ44DRAFT_633693 [Phaeosphaeriaceae sp. PMI808]